MQKEWQSWIDNKVTSLCKSRGIDPARIIRARWVLTSKKSSDPDNEDKTPKARLVLVGWQDPELGAIATDSPTLRKETNIGFYLCVPQNFGKFGEPISKLLSYRVIHHRKRFSSNPQKTSKVG